MTQPRVHLALTIAWCLLVIPTVLWWRESIEWVVFMSIYAVIASHWGAWEAARAKQEAESKEPS